MEQPTIVGTDPRNTNKTRVFKTARKSRNYCFTWNNYSQDDITYIKSQPWQYVFQEETGQSGTPHLQGLVIYPNPVVFDSVKKALPKCHLEVCKNKLASIKYCSKDDTRSGQLYTNLTSKPKERAIKEDIYVKLRREAIQEAAPDTWMKDPKMDKWLGAMNLDTLTLYKPKDPMKIKAILAKMD